MSTCCLLHTHDDDDDEDAQSAQPVLPGQVKERTRRRQSDEVGSRRRTKIICCPVGGACSCGGNDRAPVVVVTVRSWWEVVNRGSSRRAEIRLVHPPVYTTINAAAAGREPAGSGNPIDNCFRFEKNSGYAIIFIIIIVAVARLKLSTRSYWQSRSFVLRFFRFSVPPLPRRFWRARRQNVELHDKLVCAAADADSATGRFQFDVFVLPHVQLLPNAFQRHQQRFGATRIQ